MSSVSFIFAFHCCLRVQPPIRWPDEMPRLPQAVAMEKLLKQRQEIARASSTTPTSQLAPALPLPLATEEEQDAANQPRDMDLVMDDARSSSQPVNAKETAPVREPSPPPQLVASHPPLPPPPPPPPRELPRCYVCAKQAPPTQLLSCCSCSNRYHAGCMGQGSKLQCADCMAGMDDSPSGTPVEIVAPPPVAVPAAPAAAAPPVAGGRPMAESSASAASRPVDPSAAPVVAAASSISVLEPPPIDAAAQAPASTSALATPPRDRKRSVRFCSKVLTDMISLC